MTKTITTSKPTHTLYTPSDIRPVNDGTEANFEFDFDGTVARTLPEWPGYAVTPTGKVISFLRRAPIYLSPGRSDGIYRNVGLSRQSKRISTLLHRLVARAYTPNPEDKPQVNHIDGDPENNVLSNLEWVTAKENQEHKKMLGKKSRRMNEELKAKAIALYLGGMPIADIAKELDTPYQATAKAVRPHGRRCIVEHKLQPANEPFDALNAPELTTNKLVRLNLHLRPDQLGRLTVLAGAPGEKKCHDTRLAEAIELALTPGLSS